MPSAPKSTAARCRKNTPASCRKTSTARLEAAAARTRPCGRHLVRRCLELVLERLELGRLASGRMRERLCQEPVGKPRIPREEGPVQVRADHAADAATLV